MAVGFVNWNSLQDEGSEQVVTNAGLISGRPASRQYGCELQEIGGRIN